MKRWIMMLAVGVAACAGQVAADSVGFDGTTFFPDGTLTFSGDNAVLTNMHGFYEWQGASPDGTVVDVSQPLRLNGWKPTTEWLDHFPTSSAFPANTQYSYQGMWHVPVAGDYSFAGIFDDGIYLAIDGQVLLNINTYNNLAATSNVYLTAGWHALDVRASNKGSNGGKAGATWASGVIFSSDNVDFTSSANIPLGQAFGADNDVLASMGGYAHIFGRMQMTANGAIETAAVTGTPVFSGIVQGAGTLSFPDLGADPLLFGSPDPQWPAVLDGDIANALVLTNHVWLRRMPAPYTVAPGATLAFDGIACPEAPGGGHLTLNNYSLNLLASTTPAITSVTVPADRTLCLKSSYYDNGSFADAPAAFSTAVTLNGGALVFDNAAEMSFGGSFTGTGAITKDGAGDLTLAGSGSGSAATFTINAGQLLVDSAAALCDAPLRLLGTTGRLVNLNSMTLSNPITTLSGGFITPAGTVLELEGTVGGGGLSKWGEGTLRLSGTTDNTNFHLHVRGGTVELNKSSGYAVRSIGDIQPGATVKITGASGDQIKDEWHIQTSGGTFDLNGHSETVASITNTVTGSTIINNGQAPVTLTVGFGNANSTYKDGAIRDGNAQIALTKIGTGTMTLASEAFKYTGATTVDAGTLRLLPDSYIRASLFRMVFSEVRNEGANSNSGLQIGKIQLTLDGAAVNWPSLDQMTVTAPTPKPSEGPNNLVNNNAIGNGKWYVDNTSPLPATLLIECENPILFDGYRFGTGGDAQGRDPITWTFEIGTPDGTTTNWVEIDSQSKYPITTARNTYTPILSVKPLTNNLFSAAAPIIVNAEGSLVLPGFISQSIPTLTGTGTLVLEGDSTISLPNPENFPGTFNGNGTVILAGTASQFTILPQGNGITLINDGASATLLNDFDGISTWGASIKDGEGTFGITQTTGTTYYAASDSTYTGDTVISGGEACVIGSLVVAKHIRFTPEYMSGKTTPYSDYQLSRFKLMQDGKELAYPNATTARGEFSQGGKTEESPSNILLDDNTKFYSNQSILNPIIITLPFAMTFDGYAWYTANDSSGRDPVTWTVEVSLDEKAWTQVDRRENETITTTRNVKAGEWVFTEVPPVDFRAFSPNSRMTLGAGAKLSLLYASEPVGPLSGAGDIAFNRGTLLLSTFADATFAGDVTGNGAIIKQGSATQTLTGVLSYDGDLIIDGGTLDLSGATLTGVTNIILRSGTLTGTATVGNALTVTCEGGAYNAQLNVAGALTITGDLLLTAPEIPYSKTLFTYQSANTDTVTALTSAQMSPPLSAGIRAIVRTDNNSAVLSVSRGGTILMLQ